MCLRTGGGSDGKVYRCVARLEGLLGTMRGITPTCSPPQPRAPNDAKALRACPPSKELRSALTISTRKVSS